MCRINRTACTSCPITHTLISPCPSFLVARHLYTSPLDPAWIAKHPVPDRDEAVFVVKLHLFVCKHEECEKTHDEMSALELDEVEREKVRQVLAEMGEEVRWWWVKGGRIARSGKVKVSF